MKVVGLLSLHAESFKTRHFFNQNQGHLISQCVKCVPFHPHNLPKDTILTYLQDPGIYVYIMCVKKKNQPPAYHDKRSSWRFHPLTTFNTNQLNSGFTQTHVCLISGRGWETRKVINCYWKGESPQLNTSFFSQFVPSLVTTAPPKTNTEQLEVRKIKPANQFQLFVGVYPQGILALYRGFRVPIFSSVVPSKSHR